MADVTAAMTLPEFLSKHEVGELTIADRRLIVAQALLLLEQNYALLPFKVARYGINPLQRLRLMQARLGREDERMGPEWRFHAELVDIFNSLRDLHTRYVLPRPFSTAAAVLPFLLKEFTENGTRRYLVAKRGAAQLQHPTFTEGAEVTHWNGVPIGRAIDRYAESFPGANPESRHARAVDRFTVRSMAFGPPPDEDWLVVDYLDRTGAPQRVKLVWDVRSLVPAAVEAPSADVPIGLDVEGVRLARLRTELFAPEVLTAERTGQPVAADGGTIAVTPAWSSFFEARRLPGDRFGHLRIRTFHTTDVVGFVREFLRLLPLLPQGGLVLDIRGNLGGAVVGAELSLQALTARPVQPEPAQFAATLLNLRLCRANDHLEPWLASMEQALETGAPHSAALPFTTAFHLAKVPQMYFGPVVLVTDARCYSAADIFAAGFQDNRIGDVLGVDGNTGAGGGNVWKMADLLTSLPAAEDFPFRPLPDGADLTLVIRRMLRVGEKNAGTPLEDYGVVPDKQHLTTRADIEQEDKDLMTAATALLADRPTRSFATTLTELNGTLTATFTTTGMTRADVVVDGRPRHTADLTPDPATVKVDQAGAPEQVQLIAYDKTTPVAIHTYTRTPDGKLTKRTTFEP